MYTIDNFCHINPLLPVSSDENLCKQFGTRSGLTKRLARSGPKLFDTLSVFLKYLIEKAIFEDTKKGHVKSQLTEIFYTKFLSMQRVKSYQISSKVSQVLG